jgi:tetratricopeptide (TPR) repeat protein
VIGETQQLIPEDKKIGNAEQLKKQENAEELIKAYDKVLSLNPNDAYAWFNKGLTLGNLGSFQKAIECYDEAIRINPNNVDAWNNKGVAFANIGKFDEAQECFDKAKEINQKNNEYSH